MNNGIPMLMRYLCMIFAGPDQVLPADLDVTTQPNGRVRIRYDNDDKTPRVMSVPGLLMMTAKEHPDQIALVSRPGIDGTRRTWTYKFVLTIDRDVYAIYLRCH